MRFNKLIVVLLTLISSIYASAEVNDDVMQLLVETKEFLKQGENEAAIKMYRAYIKMGGVTDFEVEKILISNKSVEIYLPVEETIIPLEEKVQIVALANFLRKYPNSKLEIISEPSTLTGTVYENIQRADLRARNIKDMFINDFGIPENSIYVIVKNSNLSDKYEYDRCVININ